MALTCFGLALLAAALFYRNRRDKELLADTIEYYSELARDLTREVKKQRDLATYLAHDLKSPLAGIISSAQALELAGKELPDTYLECLRLMQVSGRTNLRLLSNFIEILGERSAKTSLQQLPDNRLDLVRGLLEPSLLNEGALLWTSAPWYLKTEIALKPFSTALAEILSLVTENRSSESKGSVVKVEESFDCGNRQLRISLSWTSDILPLSYLPSNHPYSVALEVLEKIGVQVSCIEHFENGNTLELLLPISEFVARESEKAEQVDPQVAQAEVLIEISLRQVRSASLSVGALSSLTRVEDESALEVSHEPESLDAKTESLPSIGRQ